MIMRRVFVLFTALLALSFLSGCVVNVRSVEAGTKAKDGSTYLGFDLISKRRKDKDFTHVGAKIGKFSKFRLLVDNAPVHVQRLTLVFGNGDKWNVPLKKKFKRNTWSRWVDLPGGKRHIRKIVVVARGMKKKGRMPKLAYYAR
jgi:hypothetical protein